MASDASKIIGELQKAQKKFNDELAKTLAQQKQLIEQASKLFKAGNVKERTEAVKKLNQTDNEALKLRQQVINNENKLAAATRNVATEAEKSKQKLSDYNKQLKNNVKEELAVAGSIDKARARVAQLTAERNKLNLTTEKGQKQAAKLNKLIDQNNKFIQTNVSQLEKQKINIGNYASALSGMSPAFGTATQGAAKFNTILKVLAYNPFMIIITVVVGAIMGLVAALKRSQAGIDAFRKAFDVVNTIIDVFLDRITSIGKSLLEWVKGNKSLKDTLKDVGEATKGVGDEIKEEIRLTKILADERAKLEVQMINNSVTLALLKNRIEQARTASADQTKTDKERIEQLKLANQLEERAAEVKQQEITKQFQLIMGYETEAQARDRLNSLINDGNALVREEVGLTETTNEGLKEANDIAIKFIEAETEKFKRQKENISKLTGLEEALRTSREAGNKSVEEGTQQYINQLDEVIKKNEELLMSDEFLAQEQEELFNAVTEQLDIDLRKRLLLINQSNASAQEKERQTTEILIGELERRLESIEEGGIEEIELLEELNELKQELRDAELEAIEEQAEKEKEVKNQIYDKSVELANALFDLNSSLIQRDLANVEKKRAQELKLAEGNAAEQQKINEKYDREAAALKTKQAKNDRNAAIFSAILNTAQGVTSALSLTPPLSFILAALVGILGGVQIAAIASEPIPQFRKGTSNAPAGLKIAGEAGSELMLSKDGRAMLIDKPTLFNSQGGETIFTAGQTRNILTDMQNKRNSEVFNSTSKSKHSNIDFHIDGKGIYAISTNYEMKQKRKKHYFK